MDASYVKYERQRQSDVARCPHCGHLFTESGKPKLTRRILSYSCPRLANVLRRKQSATRPKHRQDEPVLCDRCKHWTKRNEQKLCIRPLLSGSTPRKQPYTSSYRNLMRDHIATRFKQHFFEVFASNELLSDTESERFVKSTEYSLKKIEDDLKQKLFKEYFKPHIRQYNLTNSPRAKDSNQKLRMIFLNEAKDTFQELKQGSSDSGPTFSVDFNAQTNSSAQTIVSLSCEQPTENSLPAPEQVKNEKKLTSDSPNIKVILDKNSTFTKSNIKLTKTQPVSHRSDMETQYSLKSLRRKKKKWRSRSASKKEAVLTMMYEKDIQIQTALSNMEKESLNSCKALGPNCFNTKPIVKETGITTDERLETVFENPQRLQTSWQSRELRPQVTCINPSCFFVNGYKCVTRENTSTQYDVKSPRISEVCKPKVICEKGCQYQAQIINFAPEYPIMKLGIPHPVLTFSGVTHAGMRHPGILHPGNLQPGNPQPVVVQCQCQQRAHKVIQSACNHNPPCELVPSCYRVKFQHDMLFTSI